MISEPEKSLITSIAVVIHNVLTKRNRAEFKEVVGFPYGYSQYEKLAYVLWKLGLAKGDVSEDNKSGVEYQTYIALNPDEDVHLDSHTTFRFLNYNFEDKVHDENIHLRHWGEKGFNQRIVLELFILLIAKVGYPERVPVNRAISFSVENAFLHNALIELSKHGYVSVDGHNFQWTDKIAATMISNYLWTEDEAEPDNSRQSFIQLSIKNLTSIKDKIPHYSRGNISTHTSLGLTISLLEHWDGTNWIDTVLDTPKLSFEEALQTSKGFLSRFRQYGSAWLDKQNKVFFFSDSQKHLITELSKYLHAKWKERSTDFKPKWDKDGYLYCSNEAPFEICGPILWHLGLATACWPAHNLWDISIDRYIKHYESPQNLNSPLALKLIPRDKIDSDIRFDCIYPGFYINEVVVSFLDLATNYGGTLSDSLDKPISHKERDIQDALNALVENGYIDNRNGDLFWSDKTSKMMKAEFLW